jgi:hypothetical protein
VLAWVLEHWEDIASDLSVFHRIDDPDTLSIPVFLSKVVRLGAYGGALKARLAATQTAGTASPANVPAVGTPSVGGGDTPPEVVAAMKRQQFAQRYQIDPSQITWDNDQIYRELVNQ